MTTYPTYGYKKDPLDYNHYILEEKEDSLVDIDKLVKDFVNMKEITRTMLVL